MSLGIALAIAALTLATLDGGLNLLRALDAYCRPSKACVWPSSARPSHIWRMMRGAPPDEEKNVRSGRP
jgi:hypothetical protein